MKKTDLSSFAEVVGTSADVQRIRETAPGSFDAASSFWTSVFEGKHLSARLKELILVALHASSSSLNETAIQRHVARARDAGASNADILDVLLSIVAIANHALYFAVPVVLEEFKAAGKEEASQIPTLRSDMRVVRDDFVKTRGFWNEQRDLLGRLMPDYLIALSNLSMEPWKSGSLLPKERELVYIAIDCSVTHMHDAGLRIHVRNAIQHGATREEILETLQLSALMGTESYILGCQALNALAE